MITLQWTSADGESINIDNCGDYYFTALTGDGAAGGDIMQERAPGQRGASVLGVSLKGRDISFQLIATGSSLADIESKRQLIGRLFSPVSRSGGSNIGRLDLTRTDGTFFSAYCIPQSAASSGIRTPMARGFQIELFSESAFWLGAQVAITASQTSGSQFPITFPLAITPACLATNAGDVACYPIIEIDGPVTNPKIENITAGLYLQSIMIVPSGQRLQFDCRESAHTVNLISLADGAMVDEFSTLSGAFWGLAPGENLLKLSCSAGSPVAVVRYYPNFLSVA